MIGKRLGPYEIREKIGAGGMGEVYRAMDTRLGREVAVKVLPAGLSSDAERLRRFEQEARAAGLLNHPNILAIYDVGTHEGAPYVVSELLEGETLRARIGGTPLPPRKAIEYAVQAAQGLAAAHEKGLVHRDLKPENLFITQDGRVKILDFGLVKLTRPEPAGTALTNLPTTPVVTDPGAVVGTAGYMSPEQVRGQETDHRSDVFSFGAILYEMLTGRRAFRRDSAVETMNAVLKEDPPELLETNPNFPPGLDRVVRHCLEKNPAERFQSARDLAFDLETISGASGPSSTARALSARARPWRLGSLAAGGALFGLVAIAAFLAGRHLGKEPSAPIAQYHRLSFRRGAIRAARFAPDGHTILYAEATGGNPVEVFSTRSESPESRALGFPDTDLLAVSSSGELAVLQGRRQGLGWISRGTLARVPLSGGAPRPMAENVQDADWSPDGKRIAVAFSGAGRRRLEYPVGTVLYDAVGWISHVRVSPNGDRVAFLDHPAGGDDRGSVAFVDLAGKKTTLTREWSSEEGLAWSPAGDELWFAASAGAADRSLHAVDLSGRERLIARIPGHLTLQDIFRDGRVLLTYDSWRREIIGLPPGETKERNLSWLDWSFPTDLSDDGRMLLFMEQGSGAGPNGTIYLRGTDGSPAVRLGEGFPLDLSPDGKWVLSTPTMSRTQLVVLPTGAGEPRPLDLGGIQPGLLARWLPDGKRLLFWGTRPGQRGQQFFVLDPAGGPPRPVSQESVFGGYAPISPDGRVVASLGPDGRGMLYPMDGGTARPITGHVAGDMPIQWSLDGHSLYVAHRGELPARVYRLDFSTGRRDLWKEFVPSDPDGIVDINPILITPDGKAYVYSYRRALSDLYLVEGLK